MARRLRVEPGLSFAQLQARLKQINDALGAIGQVGTDGQDTVVDIDGPGTGPSAFRLALDPAGAEMPAADERLVARGEAYVAGVRQKVAAFRERD